MGILPRPVDNEQAKPLITTMNRWIRNAAEKMDVMFQKVRFLPVQLHFIDGTTPKIQYFNDDKLTVNAVGAKILKQVIFQLAGFVKNK